MIGNYFTEQQKKNIKIKIKNYRVVIHNNNKKEVRIKS